MRGIPNVICGVVNRSKKEVNAPTVKKLSVGLL
jgi:hypothetical protein